MARRRRGPIDGWQWCGRPHYMRDGLSLCGRFAQQVNNPTVATIDRAWWPEPECPGCLALLAGWLPFESAEAAS